MVEIKNNPLLFGSIIIGATYWLIAPLIENIHLSIFFAIAVALAASIALPELAQNTFQIVFKKRRSMDEQGRGRGSHLAVYGMFLFTLGSVIAGAYGLWWNAEGQPQTWIGSPLSQFGRFLHTAGFILMQFGPAVTKEGIVLDRRWWVTLLGAVLLVGVGYYFGMQVRVIESEEGYAPVSDVRPFCPPDRVIWGSSNKIHRGPDNRQRETVKQRDCFSSTEEAEEAGYRPPKN